MIRRLLLTLFVLLLGAGAFAGEAVFGPEFTFFVEGLSPGSQPNILEIPILVRKLVKRCGSACEGSFHEIKLKGTPITFKIQPDQGVWEVITTQPLPLSIFKQHEALVEGVLFEGMRSLGYVPHVVEGAGHVNMGINSAFGDNVSHFKSFLSFMKNNQGFPMVFGSPAHDRLYATQIQYFSQESQQAVAQILNEDRADLEIKDVMKALGTVYEGDHPLEYLRNLGTLKRKFMAYALRFPETPAERRMEFRTMRPQQTFHEFILEADLIQRLVNYTQKELASGKRFYYEPAGILDDVTAGLNNFKELLKRVDLPASDYSGFIAPSWKGLWASEVQNLQRSCRQVLKSKSVRIK